MRRVIDPTTLHNDVSVPTSTKGGDNLPVDDKAANAFPDGWPAHNERRPPVWDNNSMASGGEREQQGWQDGILNFREQE